MKKSSYLMLLFLYLLLICQFRLIRPQPSLEESEKIGICREAKTAQPPNYHGQSLILNSDDPEDLRLNVGDTFGDLNETYVKVEDCYFVIYHKDKMLWSLKGSEDWRVLLNGRSYEDDLCSFLLRRDGDLILKKTFWVFEYRYGCQRVSDSWSSQTNLHPAKTELRLQGQQVQIVQTFRDGSQRLFYAAENHQEFIEDLGIPRKVADQFIVKSHQDEDKTILRRNEYIGDLNGTHLILQTNCHLQLLNDNKIIWTYIPYFRNEVNCTLNVAKDNTIEISKNWASKALRRWEQESIMQSEDGLEVVESRITLGYSEPTVIQTLKNGSELIFYGGRLRKELIQIAQKTINNKDGRFLFIERMNYIGNLTGLHLILEQNCSLILANGNRKLWELKREPPNDKTAVLKCVMELDTAGDISLRGERVRYVSSRPEIFDPTGDFREIGTIKTSDSWIHKIFKLGYYSQKLSGVELTLENDHIVLKTTRKGRNHPDIFYLGPKTHGTFLQFVAERPEIYNSYVFHNLQYAQILPKMGYIESLDGSMQY